MKDFSLLVIHLVLVKLQVHRSIDLSNRILESGLCDPYTGDCYYELEAAGTACDDGDPCTLNEACDADGIYLFIYFVISQEIVLVEIQ